MEMHEDVKIMMEALLLDEDESKARDAAYRLAAEEARHDGPYKAVFKDMTRAYRLATAAKADSSVPEDVAQLVFVEHPEETFDSSRYFVTEQARRVASQAHAMRISAARLRALGLPARNTTLLYGPPGTGKTELARWVAYQEGLPLMYVNMSSTVDSLMGRTAKNISTIFRYAHKGACVLMIDELDCIANTRASAVRAADGELNRTTITFMQEIDRLPSNVVLLAATNRVDMLDPALMRRFAQVELVERLSADEVRDMMQSWVKSVTVNVHADIAFSEFDMQAIMENYEEDEAVTQATVVQRATSLLAAKLLEIADAKVTNAPRKLRLFRVIDPESDVDVTEDGARMRQYAEEEEWAQPLRYSGQPEGFLLDSAGRLRLFARGAYATAPLGRFEIVLSRFAD